jgi:hypothetical protein
MDRVCCTQGQMRDSNKFGRKNLCEQSPRGDLGLDVRKLLKRNLRRRWEGVGRIHLAQDKV